MAEQIASRTQEESVSGQDLLFIIGELSVENRMLRAKLAQLEGEKDKEAEDTRIREAS